mmetsp:Transcript_78074/g.178637  ORF Transcript_78074/g.178637 Transcript_78074/m.178637 type:complete len:192 (+) Transcript_78074:384-959(+)
MPLITALMALVGPLARTLRENQWQAAPPTSWIIPSSLKLCRARHLVAMSPPTNATSSICWRSICSASILTLYRRFTRSSSCIEWIVSFAVASRGLRSLRWCTWASGKLCFGEPTARALMRTRLHGITSGSSPAVKIGLGKVGNAWEFRIRVAFFFFCSAKLQDCAWELWAAGEMSAALLYSPGAFYRLETR